MDNFLITHPYAVAFFSIFLTIVARKVYDVWLSKKARVTPEKCGDMQKLCREQMLAEFLKFKFSVNEARTVQDQKFVVGEHNFQNLNVRLQRTNELLRVLIMVQMAFCKQTPGIDCEDLEKMLIDQGIDTTILSFQKRDDLNGTAH